jgi:hypothetical protein
VCDEDLAFLFKMDHFKSGYPGCQWGFPVEHPIPNYSLPSAFYCFSREDVVAVVAVAAAAVGGGYLVVVAVGQRSIERP